MPVPHPIGPESLAMCIVRPPGVVLDGLRYCYRDCIAHLGQVLFFACKLLMYREERSCHATEKACPILDDDKDLMQEQLG